MPDRIKVSAPGRICLFGEHQDYLHLPVIPSAISLRISIEGAHREDAEVVIHLPDVGEEESFSLRGPIRYVKERDYFRSAANVLLRENFSFSRGFDCRVTGNIPINAGTSSSSALIVAWIGFLTRMSDQANTLPAVEIARLAHRAEVLEFNEPGGMMDHFSTSLGSTIFLDFEPKTQHTFLSAPLKTFVLGNSLEPKDTKGILARVKNQVLAATERLTAKFPGFHLRRTSMEELDRFAGDITSDQRELLQATLQNYAITLEAKQALQREPLDHANVGRLLNAHQQILRDVLRISTRKIDRMIDAALNAGAYGAKINGSGGGGCMFAYAPEHPEAVIEAIERAGGKGHLIEIDQGIRYDF
ncbi:MAG: galactokinase family protein [Candidatus Zhuqueibacterota bacterium]